MSWEARGRRVIAGMEEFPHSLLHSFGIFDGAQMQNVAVICDCQGETITFFHWETHSATFLNFYTIWTSESVIIVARLVCTLDFSMYFFANYIYL